LVLSPLFGVALVAVSIVVLAMMLSLRKRMNCLHRSDSDVPLVHPFGDSIANIRTYFVPHQLRYGGNVT
jgi:hypothetical protein